VNDGARLDLIDILTRARALLARPGNDYAWSSWEDEAAALREIDGLLATLRAGQLPPRLQLSVLFTVTGPIQEVSLSSGWGAAFVDLADDYDRAEAAAYDTPPPD
jgi:hypothetical protein